MNTRTTEVVSATGAAAAPQPPRQMNAVLHPTYGPPAALTVGRTAVPNPKRGQVLIAVHAAGVNPADVFETLGTPAVMRLAFGLRRPRRLVLGHDVAGVVEAVGPGVDDLAPGDRVFGEGIGTFAEYCVAQRSRLARLPAGWSFEAAAAVPLAGTTAVQLLQRALPQPAGRRLLVIGAGGGIGTMLVQLAVHAGAEVTGVGSPAKRALVERLGAVRFIDYTTTDVRTETVRYDAIIDNAAVHTFSELIPLLAPGGLLVTNSGTGSADGSALTRPLKAAVWHQVLRRPVVSKVCVTRSAELDLLAALGTAGGLRPEVGSRVPLVEAASAVATVAEGHATGKVVITVRPGA